MVNFDPDGFLQTRGHEDLRGAPWSCIHPRAEGRPGTNARTDPVDSGDEDVVPAVLRRVVSAAVACNEEQSTVQSHLMSVQSSAGQERRRKGEKNSDKWLRESEMHGGSKFCVIQSRNNKGGEESESVHSSDRDMKQF